VVVQTISRAWLMRLARRIIFTRFLESSPYFNVVLNRNEERSDANDLKRIEEGDEI
jgi:hypothetical protein